MMIITIEDKMIIEEFKEMSGRNPTNEEVTALKSWIESDAYDWIKENIKSFLSR